MIKVLYYLRINAAFVFALLLAIPFLMNSGERGPASVPEMVPQAQVEHTLN